MNLFSILVQGKLVGKERPRRGKHGKFYTPQKTKAYERMVGYLIKEKMRKERKIITDKSVGIGLIIYYKIPKSWSKKKKKALINQEIRGAVKPDVDNIQKIIMDSLKGIYYTDDAQVGKIFYVERRYAMEPGVHISIADI